MEYIRNPIEWIGDQLAQAGRAVDSTGGALRGHAEAAPQVRRIGTADLRVALERGLADFAACRTDVVFLCLVYPLAGLILARLVFDHALLPLLFPLAAGFLLLGPAAAIGLYEMSRRREQGLTVTWADAFGTLASPSFGAILVLALLLLAIFFLWLTAAQAIFLLTLGPAPPASLSAFLHDTFATPAGWAMIGAGLGVGLLFAVLVLAVSVVSFPLLLDRDVGLRTAVRTSLRAVAANPLPMALWGLIVAGSLALASLPLFLGLIVVLPVLGHATWHLYRQLVEPPRPVLEDSGLEAGGE